MCPKTTQKGAWIGSFKPKRHLYIAISPELLIGRTSDLTELGPWNALRRWSAITLKQIQHGWRPPSWKSIWRYISAVNVSILTKFGRPMQNDTPITVKRSRSKMEVEFQYGGRLFVTTGSSYISAVNWDMSMKVGLLVDFRILKAATSRHVTAPYKLSFLLLLLLLSTNTKPEVVFSGRGRHFEKWIWRHIFATGAPTWTKFVSLMQKSIQITAKWSRSKPEVEFQYGWRVFPKRK